MLDRGLPHAHLHNREIGRLWTALFGVNELAHAAGHFAARIQTLWLIDNWRG